MWLHSGYLKWSGKCISTNRQINKPINKTNEDGKIPVLSPSQHPPLSLSPLPLSPKPNEIDNKWAKLLNSEPCASEWVVTCLNNEKKHTDVPGTQQPLKITNNSRRVGGGGGGSESVLHQRTKNTDTGSTDIVRELHLYMKGTYISSRKSFHHASPCWPRGRASASRAADLGLIPTFSVDLLPGWITPVT